MTFDQHQAVTARWMGYPDAAAMNAEHDLLHIALCNWLEVESYAMLQAQGEPLNERELMLAAMEEDAVLYLQRFIQHSRETNSG